MSRRMVNTIRLVRFLWDDWMEVVLHFLETLTRNSRMFSRNRLHLKSSHLYTTAFVHEVLPARLDQHSKSGSDVYSEICLVLLGIVTYDSLLLTAKTSVILLLTLQ